MALIKCPKCRHQVEPSEHECPKCGIIFKKYQEGVLKAQKAFEEKAKQDHKTRSLKLTKCEACNNTISRLASTCTRCGEPQYVKRSDSASEHDTTAGIIDFKFNHFITPQLVKVLYVFVLISGLIVCIGGIISSLVSPFDPFTLILAIFSYLLVLLVTRIACESALLLFKIEENTR